VVDSSYCMISSPTGKHTDRQTDRQTNMLITIVRFLILVAEYLSVL